MEEPTEGVAGALAVVAGARVVGTAVAGAGVTVMVE